MSVVEARRYQILGLLGEGGFGKVYHARLEGASGFYKEVAIKLLHDEEAHESILQRFRDEARILGLVRDRAIVGVDPPTRLAGKWAVVMEYVDGVSGEHLLAGGPLPLGVALEIVGEVARALDKVWKFPGPDGQPLNLLHRDIKPANIQITPTGEVKLLDFGIAKARFAEREARTTQHISGTLGYIAPERMAGEDGPEADVFSLGVVLHEFITCSAPDARGMFSNDRTAGTADNIAALDDEDDMSTFAFQRAADPKQDALDLAQSMRAFEPEHRPSARDVERMCEVIRLRCTDPRLRDWTEDAVPNAASMAHDELVGSTLTETLAGAITVPDVIPEHLTAPTIRREPRTSGSRMALGIAAGTSMMAVITFLAVVLVVLLAVTWVVMRAEDAPAPAIAQAPVEQPIASSAPEPSAQPTVIDDKPKPKPTQARKKRRSSSSKPAAPAPTPTKPAPESDTPSSQSPWAAGAASAAVTYPVTFSSVPLDAEVRVDGVTVGRTPLFNYPLPAGKHTITMRSGSSHIERTIQSGRRAPVRHVWKVKDNQWQSGS